MRRAFTLVELLVVVLIAAILALLAAVNYQSASTRAKVTRVYADFNAMRTAAESYAVDHNQYPRNTWGDPPYNDRYTGLGRTNDPIYGNMGPWVTTPVAYIARFDLPDPFMTNMELRADGLMYTYGCLRTLDYLSRAFNAYPAANIPWLRENHGAYFLLSYGPDRYGGGAGILFFIPYDPTNGTISFGNIVRSQKVR